MNALKEKLLLSILAGVSFGFSYSPRRQFRILKEFSKEWRKIDEKALKRKIWELYRSHLIEAKENPDGSFSFTLTSEGKLKVLTYHFQEMKIKQKNWDGKWRLVIFDIPEKLKVTRNAFREKLKELGFYELQKSVFVIPYPCEDEINFLIEFFNLRKFVRFGILANIDNELHLKKIFHLI